MTDCPPPILPGDPISVSFYGPDGCGKSTIATKFADELLSIDIPTQVLGGSSYRTWLDTKVAQEFGCNINILSSSVRSEAEKTELYEEIAVACYGLMNRLTSKDGNTVIIDSDPYLKRLFWAHTELSPGQFEQYRDNFEQKMLERVGDAFPMHVVSVRPQKSNNIHQESRELFSRMSERGVVSCYDPDNILDTTKMAITTRALWPQIIHSERFKRAGSVAHEITNERYDNSARENHLHQVAHELLSMIF